MNNAEVTVPVFRHAKRSEWGAALLTWERDGKRAYLFEDGAHRMIAEPYYPMMREVALDKAELSSSFVQQISRMSAEMAAGVLDPARDASSVFSVEEQAQLLLGSFPEGFTGESWRKHHRGEGVKSRLKRHRSAAVEDAEKLLTRERLGDPLNEQSLQPLHQELQHHQMLWQEVGKLLASTDLVPPREVKELQRAVGRADRAPTHALSALLFVPLASEDAEQFNGRFTQFVTQLERMLGRAPSWPLVTGLLALAAPNEHFCIHPASFGRQCKWLGERAISARKPNAVDYQRALTTARQVRATLSELNLKAADLLDIHDFIRSLTTPSATKRLEALRQSHVRGIDANEPVVQEPTHEAEASSTHHASPAEPEGPTTQDDVHAEAA